MLFAAAFLTLQSPWSLYVPHSGNYKYRTVVTICTAQRSLYVPHSGHYMYHQFNIYKLYVLPTHNVFMCFVWIWEQTAIISLYSINWLVLTTETECVYCAVRSGYLYIILYIKPSTAQWSLYVPPV